MEHTPVALITGAGSGLGAAIATRLSSAGWSVVISDIDLARAGAVAAEIHAAGGTARPLPLDVTDDAAWRRVKAELEAGIGLPDLLVNNAGVAVAGRLEDTPLADWQWCLDINLMGVVRGCHYFAGDMRRRGSGHIINIASYAGLAGAPEIAAYGTAKAAVIACSEALRAELAGSGVHVSVCCPAFVTTDLTTSMRAPSPDYARRVQRWMASSGVSAKDVAGVVYRCIRRPRFLILTHDQTRWMWRLKRWLPGVYYRFMDRMYRKSQRRKSQRGRLE